MNAHVDARRLLQAGRLADAERAYETILEAMPLDCEALNVVALGSLRAGRTARALELLERAAAVRPDDAATHHHLGGVVQSIGDLKRAVEAHSQAVRLEPAFFHARLSLAVCLEKLGDVGAAAVQFKRALDDAQSRGHWLDPATTPEPLRPVIARAVLAVREQAGTMFRALLEPLREKYGRDSMKRVERCLRVYLNQESPSYRDSRQRPSFLFFPDLPTSAYIDLAQFSWIGALQASTPEIRGEVQNLLPSAGGRERVFQSEALEAQNLVGIGAEPSWNGYFFFRHGVRREENCRRSPATTRALEKLPLSSIREHGPEVMFSVFTPGTHLKPHRGVTNTRVVGHLPLIVPENCALNVGGELHEWREGRVVVFDDTFEHEAWNRSEQTRVVLIFDVWNPYLSEAERAAVSDLVGAIGDFRSKVEQA